MNDFTLKYTILIYFKFNTIINKNDFYDADIAWIEEHHAEEHIWIERIGYEDDFGI